MSPKPIPSPLPVAALVPLARLRFNEDNPRLIREPRFLLLVNSLLEFPEMLRLRPTVVDESYLVLGGNMRGRAKAHLLALPDEEKTELLERHVAHRRARREARVGTLSNEAEQTYRALLQDLLYSDLLPVVVGEGLSEDQNEEFIIKDNVGFGEWDREVLANAWDHLPLHEWGLDVPTWNAPDNIDSFFEDAPDKEKEAGVRIVLDYTETEGQQVKDALAKVSDTPEQAVWQLLSLSR